MVRDGLEENIKLFLKIVSKDERVPEDIRTKSQMFHSLIGDTQVFIRGFKTTKEFLEFLTSIIGPGVGEEKMARVVVTMMLMECYNFPLDRAKGLADLIIERCQLLKSY